MLYQKSPKSDFFSFDLWYINHATPTNVKERSLPVVNGLGEVPVGSIPTNNLKKKTKKGIRKVS